MAFDLKSHLISRDVDFDIHRVHTSETQATFLCYNLSGQLTGYQRYSPLAPSLSKNSPQGKYFTYRSNLVSIFGLETLTMASKTVFITEGIFDITRLTKHGLTGIALLTNSPSTSLKNFLSCLPQKLILIPDNDDGGEFLKKSLTGIFDDIIINPYKDLGEASESFIYELRNNSN